MIESVFEAFEPKENSNVKPIFVHNHGEARSNCVRTSETPVLRNVLVAFNTQIRNLFHTKKTCSRQANDSILTFDF
jgi:hypothetical protein